MTLTPLAEEVFSDLSEPTDTTVVAITAWMAANLGKLNALTDESFEMVSADIIPDMDNIQQSILKQLYLVKYWLQKTNANLGAAAYDTPVLEITEGDRTTRLINRNEIAKNFLALKRDANDELLRLITAYKLAKASPVQVIADDAGSDNPTTRSYLPYPYRNFLDY